jgi:hypothetical protein
LAPLEFYLMKSASQPGPQAANPWTVRPANLQAAIQRRAEEIYIRNGSIPGRDLENWVQAEQEVLHEFASAVGPRSAVVVKVNGVQYIGEYSRESCDGYIPGELGPGASVPVRLDGGKMFVKRPNGKELETTIIKTIS